MKIVFVCDTMGSGGAERVISSLSNELVKHSHDVSILMIGKDATNSFYYLDESIKLSRLEFEPVKRVGFFKRASMIKDALLTGKPDIVISFISYVCIYTWWALRKTNIPYIVSERNDPNHRGKLKQLLLNQSFKNAAGCVFQTHDAFEWYRKIAKNKSVVIHNPVNIEDVKTTISSKKKQILYVGRLTEQKNCELLIEAFALFSKEHPDYTLKMYGDGTLKQELNRRINDLSLNDKVFIFSSSKTWKNDESNSSMFVLPSKYEGMPNVLAEALCIGIPCVSTDCTIGGPKELKKIFGDRLSLCKNNDAIDLTNKMNEMLKVDNVKPCVPECLTIKYIATKWIEFINERLNLIKEN